MKISHEKIEVLDWQGTSQLISRINEFYNFETALDATDLLYYFCKDPGEEGWVGCLTGFELTADKNILYEFYALDSTGDGEYKDEFNWKFHSGPLFYAQISGESFSEDNNTIFQMLNVPESKFTVKVGQLYLIGIGPIVKGYESFRKSAVVTSPIIIGYPIRVAGMGGGIEIKSVFITNGFEAQSFVIRKLPFMTIRRITGDMKIEELIQKRTTWAPVTFVEENGNTYIEVAKERIIAENLEKSGYNTRLVTHCGLSWSFIIPKNNSCSVEYMTAGDDARDKFTKEWKEVWEYQMTKYRKSKKPEGERGLAGEGENGNEEEGALERLMSDIKISLKIPEDQAIIWAGVPLSKEEQRDLQNELEKDQLDELSQNTRKKAIKGINSEKDIERIKKIRNEVIVEYDGSKETEKVHGSVYFESLYRYVASKNRSAEMLPFIDFSVIIPDQIQLRYTSFLVPTQITLLGNVMTEYTRVMHTLSAFGDTFIPEIKQLTNVWLAYCYSQKELISVIDQNIFYRGDIVESQKRVEEAEGNLYRVESELNELKDIVANGGNGINKETEETRGHIQREGEEEGEEERQGEGETTRTREAGKNKVSDDNI